MDPKKDLFLVKLICKLIEDFNIIYVVLACVIFLSSCLSKFLMSSRPLLSIGFRRLCILNHICSVATFNSNLRILLFLYLSKQKLLVVHNLCILSIPRMVDMREITLYLKHTTLLKICYMFKKKKLIYT